MPSSAAKVAQYLIGLGFYTGDGEGYFDPKSIHLCGVSHGRSVEGYTFWSTCYYRGKHCDVISYDRLTVLARYGITFRPTITYQWGLANITQAYELLPKIPPPYLLTPIGMNYSLLL